MKYITLATLFIALSLQAGTRPPAAVQTGPYSWTTGTYEYDAAGNIKTIGPWMFAYDPLNRLSTSHMTTPDTVSDQTYVYDPFGNMIQQSTSGIPTPLPTDVTTNHLDATIAGYDDAGNTVQYQPPLSGHTYAFTYDAFNMVTEESADNVMASYFVYTADDERLRIETANGATKHWRIRDFGQQVLSDFQHSGSTWSLSRNYIYRDQPLAAITPTTLENFTLDHLNSPRLISDVVGNKIALHTYLPYGKELGAAVNDGEPLKFTGHERDDDPTGGTNPLDYMHARYYPSDIGRFLSIDPKSNWTNVLTHAQLLNRYTYAADNPVNAIDPDGAAPYWVNRKIGGGPAISTGPGAINYISHSFVATTSGGLHTYSWGNVGTAGDIGSWHEDSPEDIRAAKEALAKNLAKKEGDDSLDPYIRQAFLNHAHQTWDKSNHWNLGIVCNCKTEAQMLLNEARKLQKEDKKRKEEEERKRREKQMRTPHKDDKDDKHD